MFFGLKANPVMVTVKLAAEARHVAHNTSATPIIFHVILRRPKFELGNVFMAI
jgi:hypothetical protein